MKRNFKVCGTVALATLAVAVVGLLALTGQFASASPGTTERVSVASDGSQAGCGFTIGCSGDPTISGGGGFVAFESIFKLVPEDTGDVQDIFVRDRLTGITERVSVASDGSQAGCGFTIDCSGDPPISGDGCFVAFESIFKLVPE